MPVVLLPVLTLPPYRELPLPLQARVRGRHALLAVLRRVGVVVFMVHGVVAQARHQHQRRPAPHREFRLPLVDVLPVVFVLADVPGPRRLRRLLRVPFPLFVALRGVLPPPLEAFPVKVLPVQLLEFFTARPVQAVLVALKMVGVPALRLPAGARSRPPLYRQLAISAELLP